MGSSPAMSTKATKAVSQKIRAWHLSRRSDTDLSDLAREINPQVRGWIGYYGAFYRSRLYLIALRIDQHLVRWAMQKYKRLRGKPQRAGDWLDAARQRQPSLFVHWHLIAATQGRPAGAAGGEALPPGCAGASGSARGADGLRARYRAPR